MKLFVTVKPGSKKVKVVIIGDNNFTVNLTSPARNNKANLQLIKVLANYLKIPRSKISIVKGLKIKNKIITISE
ncbi:DUF167 domain-containing protein [Patescibacteria group bacterium]